MKEFQIPEMYMGIQIFACVVAPSQKKAAEVLGRSLYEIKTYAHSFEPRSAAKDNPMEKHGIFEWSGQAPYFVPKNQIGVAIPWLVVKRMIREYKAKYPSWQDAEEAAKKNPSTRLLP